MQKINSLSFQQLKNAEHVSFFTNVGVAINKLTATAVGLTEAQMKQYTDAVNLEQDIVNHSTGSIYTPEMKALDDERDRLYRLIRLKLQAVTLASPSDDVAQYATTVDKYILTKYGLDVCGAPYQEESALIRGFILDIQNMIPEEGIAAMGIASELAALTTANEGFADQYNERVTEKSGSTTEYTKKLRGETEELYNLIALHVEFKANTDTTSEGESCVTLLAVINELIKDAHYRLNQRLGKVSYEEEGDDDNPVISPVPFPNK